MNIDELFPPALYKTAPPPQPLDKMISAAWLAPGLTTYELTTLSNIKRAYRSGDGFCLSDDTLAWLTKLARKGGWKPAKQKESQHAQ